MRWWYQNTETTCDDTMEYIAVVRAADAYEHRPPAIKHPPRFGLIEKLLHSLIAPLCSRSDKIRSLTVSRVLRDVVTAAAPFAVPPSAAFVRDHRAGMWVVYGRDSG
ncbi:hypothetical protein EVAR_38559_1 [Eumeta japonica]|uniref:Uncharacterized protein n=1 Tax=Eumeta variegata TaxID=151549 RepID=A0A4C1WW78_EUMVA|nr:hypothetical protein EVAR_38559_1 [Eumeta japonica]